MFTKTFSIYIYAFDSRSSDVDKVKLKIGFTSDINQCLGIFRDIAPNGCLVHIEETTVDASSVLQVEGLLYELLDNYNIGDCIYEMTIREARLWVITFVNDIKVSHDPKCGALLHRAVAEDDKFWKTKSGSLFPATI